MKIKRHPVNMSHVSWAVYKKAHILKSPLMFFINQQNTNDDSPRKRKETLRKTLCHGGWSKRVRAQNRRRLTSSRRIQRRGAYARAALRRRSSQ